MSDYSIELFNSLAVSTDFVNSITDIVRDYQDSTRAVGGYWTGSFALDEPLEVLEEWFNYFLGFRVARRVGGITRWEGLISQMRLAYDNQTYVRDLNTMVNRASVLYTSKNGTTSAQSAWDTVADSLNQFGQREEVFAFDGADATMANAFRDTQLTEWGWPRSRSAGGSLFNDKPSAPPRLFVQLSGYAFTLNWRFVASNSATDANASGFITTLADEGEFVSSGNIDTNTLQVAQRFLAPTRIWDGIERVAALGDTSGNRYIVQVLDSRTLDYRAAATTVEYYIRDRAIYAFDGSSLLASEIQPDKIAHRADAPAGYNIGSSDKDDPRNVYIEEVVFKAPGMIQIRASDWTLADQLEFQLAEKRERER